MLSVENRTIKSLQPSMVQTFEVKTPSMKTFIICLLVLLPSFLIAQVPEPKPNTYVNDLSGKLSVAQVEQLNQSIRRIEDSTKVQLAVILVNDISIPIEDYTREIGRKWHVGNADNGLVYVCVINSRQQRLEVANHLQGTIPDIVAGKLIRKAKSFYKQGQYYEGLQQIVLGVEGQVMPVAEEQKALISPSKPIDGFVWFMAVLFSGGIVALVWWYWHRKYKKEEKENQERRDKSKVMEDYYRSKVRHNPRPEYSSGNTYVTPIIITDHIPSEDYPYTSFSSDSSSSSSSSSDSSSDYGSWGSDSSDSSSSYDSGFSGGGSSDSW